MAKLMQWPESPINGAYGFINPQHDKYMKPWCIYFLQTALMQAMEHQGGAPAIRPICIADASRSDGGTPAGHPGEAHSGGDDCDITYAMNTTDGDNYVGPIVQTNRGPMLSGPPKWMQTGYQAGFIASIASLDRQLGPLVWNIAVDPRIEAVLEKEIETYTLLLPETRKRARDLLNFSKDPSWWAWHADHLHIRFYDPEGDEDALSAMMLRVLNAAIERLRKLRTPVTEPVPAPPVVVTPPPPVPIVLTTEQRLAKIEAWITSQGGML